MKNKPRQLWDEIIYPLPNINGHTFEVWEWISKFSTPVTMGVFTYPFW